MIQDRRMTALPDHTARLTETTKVLVLDPAIGPIARPLSAIALGDEILAVSGGRICFRRVMASTEAPQPEHVVRIAVDAIGPQIPRNAILLDRRQPIGRPALPADLAAAADFGSQSPADPGRYWFDITVEGAERIIAENLSLATGPLPGQAAAAPTPTPTPTPTPAPAPQFIPAPEPTAAPIAPVESGIPVAGGGAGGAAPSIRAYSGPIEVVLSSIATEGDLNVYRFALPPRTTTLRLSSPSVAPPGDGRRLGVAVARLVVESTDIALESPALVRGFHRAESGQGLTWRWTDGEALLLLPPKPVPQSLSVYFTNWHLILAPST
jgi:hypothetical protein